MKNLFFIALMGCMCLPGLMAQGVKISSSPGNPDPSAGLDIDFNDKGLLLPRLTTVQRDAIANPAEGLTIYNTVNKCIEGFFPSGWKQVACDCVQPPPAPAPIQGPLHVCLGDAGVLFHIPPVTGAMSYMWVIDNQDTLIGNTSNDSIWINFSANSGNRTISVMAINTCGNSQPTVMTVDVSNPDAQFTFTPGAPSVGVPVTFTPNDLNLSYNWTFTNGNPGSSTNQIPVVDWSNTGDYAVTLDVVDNEGCMSTYTDTTHVIFCLPGSQTFSYTGSPQTWVVPNCVTSVTIELWGAQGGAGSYSGNHPGGLGGYSKGDLAVTGGQVLHVYVGGKGTDYGGPGGWNGGGNGGSYGAGGGGTDVRTGGTSFNDRVIVAGGGGGSTGVNCPGGHGGGTTGQSGIIGSGCSGMSNNEGTQSAGGPGNGPGGFGYGGDYNSSNYSGGGGGWYGGGAAHGAGGGSGYIGSVTNASMQTGIRTGNGQAIISW